MTSATSPAELDIATRLGADAEGRSRRRWRKRLGWGGLAIAIGIAAYALLRRAGAEPGYDYRTQPVRRGALTVTVTATGALEPLTQVNVGTEISGIVEAVAVDYNDHVRAGQTLARLNTDKLDAQARQARASLEVTRAARVRAQATLAEARSEFGRLEELRRIDATTAQSWEAAEAALRRAEAESTSAGAQIGQAEATLAAIESDRRKATIRSPIDGIVLDRQVDPGQTVAASFQTPVLFVLARDLSKMTLSVDVDEADVGRVTVGQTASFTVDAYPNQAFTSRVTAVRSVPKTVSGVVTYEAILTVDNAELLLKPGMTATAAITVAQVADAVLVPNAALRFSPPDQAEATEGQGRGGVTSLIRMPRMPGGPRRPAEAPAPRSEGRVWVLEQGKPVARVVTIGATDGAVSQLLSGELEPGTPVIVDAVARP